MKNDPPITGTPEEVVKREAHAVGFSSVGIADLEPIPYSHKKFQRWIDEGKHGDLHYLVKNKKVRSDPGALLNGARSAICVALNYYIKEPVENLLGDDGSSRGFFSIYALKKDYHLIIKTMLDELSRRLRRYFPHLESIACVDTKPVPERTLALKAGLGWLGKNTCVISPEFGSWIFLGELIVNMELSPDRPQESLCGTCRQCIDECPSGALGEDFDLDSRKCVSYLTIEKRGDIPEALHRSIGDHVFGCDICQKACPYNSDAKISPLFDSYPVNPIVMRPLDKLAKIDDETFQSLTRESSIRRCGVEGMRRNAAIAIKNMRDFENSG